MSTPLQFAAKMAAAPAQIEAAQKRMVAAAALVVTTSIRAEISLATRGTNRLSGVGRKGAKVGVGFDVKGIQNPTALVAARGPLHLLERDTKAHSVAPRNKRGGKRALGNKAKGFGPVASAVRPEVKGKHPFQKGVDAGIPGIRLAADAEMTRTIAKILGGV